VRFTAITGEPYLGAPREAKGCGSQQGGRSCGSGRIVDDVAPDTVPAATGDIARRAAEIDRAAVACRAVKGPVDDEQCDVSSDVDMPQMCTHGQAKPEQVGVRGRPCRTCHRIARARYQHALGLVHTIEGVRIAIVERREE
jgi:hypothetical protein